MDWEYKRYKRKNSEIEEQTVMNNTVTEMKNTLEGFNSRRTNKWDGR